MSFSLAFAVVAPLITYLLLGALLGRGKTLSAQSASEINRVLYLYCFPLVMAMNIYHADLKQSFNPGFVIMMIGLVLLTSLALVLILPRFFKDKKALGSMLQGIIRSNALLFALPVVQTISGRDQTGLLSLCVATVVPTYNIICVIILETLKGEKVRPGRLVLSILKNPIILGALSGVLLKLSGIQLPELALKIADSLTGLVTPVALVVLGTTLHFADARKYKVELLVVVVLKLLVIPVFFVLAVRLAGFGPVAMTTAMALAAVPTAVSSYAMAREMRADAVLAGQIVAATTAASSVSVFLWVLVLSSLGWIG